MRDTRPRLEVEPELTMRLCLAIDDPLMAAQLHRTGVPPVLWGQFQGPHPPD
jgi:hypothetical protein